MSGFLMLAGMLLAISVMSSTREGRRAAAEKMKPHNWKFGAAAAVIWAAILWDFMVRR